MFFHKKKSKKQVTIKKISKDNKRNSKEVRLDGLAARKKSNQKDESVNDTKDNMELSKNADKTLSNEHEVKEIKKEQEKKKQLYDFFENHKANESKLIKSKKKKRFTKRESKKQKEYLEFKSRRLYKYKKQKYKKVEDFITYLNEHYLDLDEIAKEVLADEAFLGWIQKKSGIFEQSIKEFSEIRKKIETK